VRGFGVGGGGGAELWGAVLRIAPESLGGAALIIVSGFVAEPMRSILWIAAVAVGYFGPLLAGVGGFRVHPAHFVERHGLIVIVAIGESLVAIGLGARQTELGFGVISAAILGLVVATSLWLADFHFFTIRAPRFLGG